MVGKKVEQMAVVMAENLVSLMAACLANLWAVQLVVKMDHTRDVMWVELMAEKMESMMVAWRDMMKEFLMAARKGFRLVVPKVERMVDQMVSQMGDYLVENLVDAMDACLVEKMAEKLGIQTVGQWDQGTVER